MEINLLYSTGQLGLSRWLRWQRIVCKMGDLVLNAWWEVSQRRKWQPTPVFLPGEFHGQRSLVGYSPWCHKEMDMAEQLSTHLISYPKINSKQIKDLNIRPETVKLLGETVRDKLLDIDLGNAFF